MEPGSKKRRSKEVSMAVKEAIIRLRQEKKSIRDIAGTLGISKSTVLYIIKKRERTGELSNGKRTGRPRKTTLIDDQKMLAILEKNPMCTVKQIQSSLQGAGIAMSQSTIKRRLYQQKQRGFTHMLAVDEDALGGPPAVTQFLAWCDHVGVKLNPKVAITSDGSVAQYGLIARDHLMDGEVLFSVPRSALLSQDTSRIQDLLERERDRLESPSGWVPLLLALLYEATDGTSPWAPYFGLWPGLDPPDLPMFWSEEERMRLLRGTGVAEAVSKDLQNMEREYNTIVLPFIQRHPKTFSAEKHTLDLYKRLVAFVMAYSFQEPVDEEEDCGKRDPPPMMVPVADLLNHVTENNARLEFTPDYLRMVATRPVQPGQEIFNTYGQMANWQLLHMYGFTEPHPHNASETADIRMWTLHRAALQGASSAREQAQVQERWKFLCRLEMVAEDGVLVFGREEVMTDDELRTCLKVLCMSEEKFAEYKENEGWEEDDEEEEPPLMLEDLSDLPARWRKLLHTSTALTLATYTDSLETEQAALTDTAAYVALSARERHAMQVRYGQKLILQRILDMAKE